MNQHIPWEAPVLKIDRLRASPHAKKPKTKILKQLTRETHRTSKPHRWGNKWRRTWWWWWWGWPHKSRHNSLRLHMVVSTREISMSIPILISTFLIAPVSVAMMVRTISTRMWTTIAVPKWVTTLRRMIITTMGLWWKSTPMSMVLRRRGIWSHFNYGNWCQLLRSKATIRGCAWIITLLHWSLACGYMVRCWTRIHIITHLFLCRWRCCSSPL